MSHLPSKEERAAAELMTVWGWRLRYVANLFPIGTFRACWTHPLLPGLTLTYDPNGKPA